MSADGKVRVVVKSRRVPIRTVDVSEPIFSASGAYLGTTRNSLTLYDSSLDDNHRKAIEEGRKLACNLGLGLEVVDASTSGLFRRIRSSLRLSGSSLPSLVVSPFSPACEGSALQDLGSAP